MIITNGPMLQNPVDSVHSFLEALNIVAHFLLLETCSCSGCQAPVLSLVLLLQSQLCLLILLCSLSAQLLTVDLPLALLLTVTVSLRRLSCSSISLTHQGPTALRSMSLNRAPSPTADQTVLPGCHIVAETSIREIRQHTQRVGELRFIMPAGPEELTLQALSPERRGYRVFIDRL